MPLPPDLLNDLEDMPRQLEQALRLVPRTGEFAEYGRLTLHAQHLAGIQWLAGKIASDTGTQ